MISEGDSSITKRRRMFFKIISNLCCSTNLHCSGIMSRNFKLQAQQTFPPQLFPSSIAYSNKRKGYQHPYKDGAMISKRTTKVTKL